MEEQNDALPIPGAYFNQPEDTGSTYWCPECLLKFGRHVQAALRWDADRKRFGVYCFHCRNLHLETREECSSADDHEPESGKCVDANDKLGQA